MSKKKKKTDLVVLHLKLRIIVHLFLTKGKLYLLRSVICSITWTLFEKFFRIEISVMIGPAFHPEASGDLDRIDCRATHI